MATDYLLFMLAINGINSILTQKMILVMLKAKTRDIAGKMKQSFKKHGRVYKSLLNGILKGI